MIVLCLTLIFLTLLLIFPPSSGRLPQFRDEAGDILDNSIAEKVTLSVDGASLGLFLLAKDKKKPVLLVCGGGPGIPEYLLEATHPSYLSEQFVVCYWDYRGTGLSYSKSIRPEEMTKSRYLADTAAVTQYLQQRFSQEKVYILGHSFGTYIALNAIKQHPESYIAYLAMSQICNQKESEYLAYDYMKNQYKQQGNKKMVKALADCPIRESDEAYDRYFRSGLRDTAMHRLGVGTTRKMASVISGIFWPSLRCRAYTWQERLNIWRGKVAAGQFPVSQAALTFNAFEAVSAVQIPIYFLAGEYDYTCCQSLQKAYYDTISAPEKRYFLFKNTAHSPLFEKPVEARKLLAKLI